MNIQNTHNFPAGYYNICPKSLVERYRKSSKRLNTIILDIPGVLVSFLINNKDSLYRTQCVHVQYPGKNTKEFVYFRERQDLHWFLTKLKRKYEIIVWSSLDWLLTEKIISHIQRNHSYFSYVLCRNNWVEFEQNSQELREAEDLKLVEKSPENTKIPQDMPSYYNFDFKNKVRDLSIFLDNREKESIYVVNCHEELKDDEGELEQNEIFNGVNMINIKPWDYKTEKNLFSHLDSENFALRHPSANIEVSSSSSSFSSNSSDSESEENDEVVGNGAKVKKTVSYKFSDLKESWKFLKLPSKTYK